MKRVGIKFCFKLGRTTTETYGMLEVTSGKKTMSGTQTFEWFLKFTSGMTSVEDADRLGYCSSLMELCVRSSSHRDELRMYQDFYTGVRQLLRDVPRTNSQKWRTGDLFFLLQDFLSRNRITVVPDPPLSPCDFSLIPKLKLVPSREEIS